MQPVDKRLLARSAPMRAWILTSGALTALGSVATIALGIGIGQITATALVRSASDHGFSVLSQAEPLSLSPAEPLSQAQELPFLLSLSLQWQIAILIALAAVRIGVAWALARFGQSAAAEVIADLRAKALAAVATADPRTVDTAYWRTMLTVGVGGLANYISGFLPALVAMVISTPVALAAVAWLDLPSFFIAAITLPLIPLFMWLVGRLTEGRTEARLRDIGIVRGQILDLIEGLPTLHAHGMADAPAGEIDRLSTEHQRSSMAVLRIAFLSGMVLEFLATLSVALVAVGIGFRLIDGEMTLAAGLAVLIIIPEVYGPVRAVGTRFHDAQDGVVAASAVLDLLGRSQGSELVESEVAGQVASASEITVRLDHFSAPGRDGICPNDLSLTARPGEIVVLAGDNGVGKSTALLAIAGIVTDQLEGTVTVLANGQPLPAADRMAISAWVPQRPVLDPTVMGDNSALSLGQRHRVALREELADPTRHLVLLDEPTAHLDQASARQVLADVRRRAQAGATVIIASHDPLVFAAADRVVEVHKK